MNAITVEELAQAIRMATSLTHLKRLVGPSPEETLAAEQRIKRIDELWDRAAPRYGYNIAYWPEAIREKYDRLNAEQTEFENTYF